MSATERIRLRHQPMRGVNVKLTDDQRAFLDTQVEPRDRSAYIRQALDERISRDRESRQQKKRSGK